MEINILKWEEYNTKSDFRTPHWFKVNVNIPSSRSLFNFNCTTKWIWICLLSEAMKHKSGKFDLNVDWASHFWNLKRIDILEAIKLFNENGLLRVDSESTQTGLRPNSVPEKKREEEKREEEKATAAFVPKELKEQWIKTYEDEKWIDFEIKKSQSWLLSNPNKHKKDFARYYNNWLARSWDQRKAAPKPNRAPSGIPTELNVPDPRSGPLKQDIKALLDKSLGRTNEDPKGAA